jgi:uncharacterized protein (DUF1697 family)
MSSTLTESRATGLEGELVHVAFLRNVMVGRGGLTRAVLEGAFRDCGATFAESFLATGNIVFEPGALAAGQVAECAACRLQEEFGLREPFFVRSMGDLEALQAAMPFSAARGGDVHERTVSFFDELARPLPPLPIRSKRGDCEVFSLGDCEAYGVTWLIDGRTGNPGKLVEDMGSTLVTTRNWNTIERLVRRYGPSAASV